MKKINEILKDLREDADLDQRDVAQHLGITQQVYSTYERGQYDVPSRLLVPLAQLYHVNTDYLLGATDYKLSLEHLNRPFTSTASVGAILSDLLSLDADGRNNAVEYINFLKSKKKA